MMPDKFGDSKNIIIMKEKVICGMQQVGIGVENVHEAFKWYMEAFGCNAKILDAEGTAERMLPYTGGKPQDRWAILAYNLRGGGGFEIWQPQGRALRYLQEPVRLGDLGILCAKIKAKDIQWAYNHLKQVIGAKILCEPVTALSGRKHFFLLDVYGNLFQVEEDNYVFIDQNKATGGANGAVIGVSDMEKSMAFYGKLLGFDRVEYDETGVFDDLQGVEGGDKRLRRVMLNRTKPMQGPLSEIMGTAHIELVQALEGTPKKLYEGRWWGDPGFIHLCFDVRNMEAVKADAEALGHPFVCDSGADFKMGEADGHFTYVEDPDGTLIEFVETFKIPVLKKMGIYLHLDGKDDKKPLPRYITKALRFLEVKG